MHVRFLPQINSTTLFLLQIKSVYNFVTAPNVTFNLDIFTRSSITTRGCTSVALQNVKTVELRNDKCKTISNISFLYVIVTKWRGCTVLCFTRSPRWGTGHERDLKRDPKKKQNKIKQNTTISKNSDKYISEIRIMWLPDTYLCCLYSCTSRRFVFVYSVKFKWWILASVRQCS
jgi:hypothetical protein